ncbi:hypothetical protein [Microbacterium sp. NPDC087589]|uniref:hypothetical protein n=1 Tax=Microbacterium sp. NPDC087589 TaxID=3364191 RepID=UPI003808EBBC
MTSRAGRKIGAFRYSGVNPRPQPQPTTQAAQQPQQRPQPGTLTIGPGRPSPRAQAHLDAAKDTRLTDPPRIPASAPTVSVHIDGAKVSIPSDWAVAFSSRNDKDVLYGLEPSGKLHVLVINGSGQLRALDGLTDALVSDIIRWRFPRGVR